MTKKHFNCIIKIEELYNIYERLFEGRTGNCRATKVVLLRDVGDASLPNNLSRFRLYSNVESFILKLAECRILVDIHQEVFKINHAFTE